MFASRSDPETVCLCDTDRAKVTMVVGHFVTVRESIF